MNNIIKKVELRLGKRVISLTVEEAERLKEVLAELFEKEIVREPYPVYPDRWYWTSGTCYYGDTTCEIASNVTYTVSNSTMKIAV